MDSFLGIFKLVFSISHAHPLYHIYSYMSWSTAMVSAMMWGARRGKWAQSGWRQMHGLDIRHISISIVYIHSLVCGGAASSDGDQTPFDTGAMRWFQYRRLISASCQFGC